MAAEKKTTIAKDINKGPRDYKVIGEGFTDKVKANAVLKEIYKKGFKSAGLMVQGNKFVVLFGTYTTQQAAKANAAAVQQAGFNAIVVE